MKKTLFGVLAFVLVLATVLTGTVFAAKTDATTNIGSVPMVPAATPIKVDGKMDEVYTAGKPAVLDFYSAKGNDVYTLAYAYFAWSAEENALYCFVIVNDFDKGIAKDNGAPWEADSVELFIDWTNDGVQSWGIEGLTNDGKLQRGLQYRISAKGVPSCYLLEEDGGNGEKAAGGYDAIASTYEWDSDLGRFANEATNLLINENVNKFGWTHDEDDETLVDKGWGAGTTDYGYTVEYKINCPREKALAIGDELGFDIQLNDLYVDANSGNTTQANVYYGGTYRESIGNETAGNDCQRYDYFTLGAEATNSRILDTEELDDYGMAEATSITTQALITRRTTTKKVTINRVYTTKAPTTTKPAAGNNNQGGDGNNQGGGETQKDGGCGSSIAIGSSVAMIAMVGAAGFFTFRRKKDND